MIGKYVLVRTYSAGVHVGVLASRNGREATLTDTRRVWSWRGARTLSEMSLRGVDDGSRLSEAVPENLLLEAIEIIPCSLAAEDCLRSTPWA